MTSLVWPIAMFSDAYRSALNVFSRLMFARAVHDLHEDVVARQDRLARPLEDQRPSAGVQRLGHDGAAERGGVARPPDDDARRVRRVRDRAGDEDTPR